MERKMASQGRKVSRRRRWALTIVVTEEQYWKARELALKRKTHVSPMVVEMLERAARSEL